MSNEMLYHYTNLEGFIGILKSGYFRAKNGTKQKDSVEVLYPRCLLKNVLTSCPGIDNKSVEKIMHALDKSIDRKNNSANQVYPICTVSFSKEKDSTNQWENYGRYCFEFKKDEVEKAFKICYRDKTECKGQLKDCIYDYEIQKKNKKNSRKSI